MPDRAPRLLLAAGAHALALLGIGPIFAATVDEATAGRLAALALDCVHREYPNKISHVLNSDDDARPPRAALLVRRGREFYGDFRRIAAERSSQTGARRCGSVPS